MSSYFTKIFFMSSYFTKIFLRVHKFDLMNKSISLNSNTLLVYKLALGTLGTLGTLSTLSTLGDKHRKRQKDHDASRCISVVVQPALPPGGHPPCRLQDDGEHGVGRR